MLSPKFSASGLWIQTIKSEPCHKITCSHASQVILILCVRKEVLRKLLPLFCSHPHYVDDPKLKARDCYPMFKRWSYLFFNQSMILCPCLKKSSFLLCVRVSGVTWSVLDMCVTPRQEFASNRVLIPTRRQTWDHTHTTHVYETRQRSGRTQRDTENHNEGMARVHPGQAGMEGMGKM